MESKAVELIHSDALIFEVTRNPNPKRRSFLMAVLRSASVFQGFSTATTQRAEQITSEYNIKGLDALHLACAEAATADHFITCDDQLIKRYHGKLSILNPVNFIMLFTQEDDHNGIN